MSHPPPDSTLADRHYVTLILRLTLDRGGRVIQGELVDTTDTLWRRFTSSSGLSQAVETWLRQQEQAESETEQ